MRQYNHKADKGTFLVIDYGKIMGSGHSTDVLYMSNFGIIKECGWVDGLEEGNALVRETAKNLGLKLVGFERVA